MVPRRITPVSPARVVLAVPGGASGSELVLVPRDTYGELKISFKLCIPIWAGGRVVEVYCISRLRSTAELEESLRLAELVALAAGRRMHRLDRAAALPHAATAH